MLSAIKEALEEAVEASSVPQDMTDKDLRLFKIEQFLRKNDYITNADVRQLFQVSSATTNRILAGLVAEGKLEKIRVGKSWAYVLA